MFAAEDDGFDDALASLDVEDLVAASQRGVSKKHIQSPGRPGGMLNSWHKGRRHTERLKDSQQRSSVRHLSGSARLSSQMWGVAEPDQ